MNNEHKSTNDFLEEQQRKSKSHQAAQAEARTLIEQSKLVETLDDVCAEINGKAHDVVVDAQSYFPPVHRVRTFSFAKGSVEFVMQIELWDSKPTLKFMSRHWRDISSNPLVRWAYHLAHLDPVAVSTKFSALVDEDNLIRSDVEQWFCFLLSGLNHKFAPSGPGLGVLAPVKAEEDRTPRSRAASASG
jgi:hypothetical protein